MVELNTYCFSCLLPWIYTSSFSMNHRISSLLILASCMSVYNRLPPSNRVHASVLLSSAKRHKSFSNFLLIVDFFLSLLLLSLFMIDSDFGLSCNSFHMICLMYFILSCVLSNLYNDGNPFLLFIGIVLLGTYYLLRDRYARYV
jgi:hypothetical protein